MRKSSSPSLVTVKSPAMPPFTPIRGVRQDRPTARGILLAKIASNQSEAPSPRTEYLAKFEMSMMPAWSRSMRHSSPTGPHQFWRVKPFVSLVPGVSANHAGCSQP